MTRTLHVPQRTCVGCRETAARGALVRVVRGHEGALVVDRGAVLPGRGAWVHPTAACIDRAVRRGGLARGLKTQVASAGQNELIAMLTGGGRTSSPAEGLQ